MIAVKEHPIIFSTESVKAILDGRKTQTRRVVTPSTSIVGEGKVDWSKFCWDGSQIYRDTCIHGHTEKHQAILPFVDGKASELYPYEHQYLHVPYNWEEDMTIFRIYPKWEVGDRLWVKETWKAEQRHDDLKPSEIPISRVLYLSDSAVKTDMGLFYPDQIPLWFGKLRVSLFMPRWASRITLEITEVRVERVQEISPHKLATTNLEREGLPYKNRFGIDFTTKLERYVLLEEFSELWDSLNAGRGYGWEVNPWVWVIGFKVVK